MIIYLTFIENTNINVQKCRRKIKFPGRIVVFIILLMGIHCAGYVPFWIFTLFIALLARVRPKSNWHIIILKARSVLGSQPKLLRGRTVNLRNFYNNDCGEETPFYFNFNNNWARLRLIYGEWVWTVIRQVVL